MIKSNHAHASTLFIPYPHSSINYLFLINARFTSRISKHSIFFNSKKHEFNHLIRHKNILNGSKRTSLPSRALSMMNDQDKKNDPLHNPPNVPSLQIQSGRSKYASFDELKMDVEEYLQKAIQDIRDQNAKAQAASELAITSTSSSIQNITDVLPPLIELLEYTQLAKNDRFDLIQGLLAYGGYIEVAKALGYPLDSLSSVVLEKKIAQEKAAKVLKAANFVVEKPKDGYIKLGVSRDELLTSEEVEKAMKRAKEKEELERLRNIENEKKMEFLQRYRLVEGGRLISTNELEALAAAKYRQPPPRVGESIHFEVPLRINMSCTLLATALAFSKIPVNSAEMLKLDSLSALNAVFNAAQDIRPVVVGLLMMHVFAAAATAVLAYKAHRSVPLWVFKGLLGGVGAVWRLQQWKDEDEEYLRKQTTEQGVKG